jgi:hypothetical protein
MNKYLTMDDYAKVLQTYSDSEIENNWKSPFIMTELFELISTELSLKFNFQQNKEEQENTVNYLKHLHIDQKNYG